MVAPRSVPSALPPSRFAKAIARRFQAGTKAWIRFSAGSASKASAAALRSSAAGMPHNRFASRICAVATQGEAGSSATSPPSCPSFHIPKVLAVRNRSVRSSTVEGKKSSTGAAFAHPKAAGSDQSGKSSLISISIEFEP
jgi:hypothetical protein